MLLLLRHRGHIHLNLAVFPSRAVAEIGPDLHALNSTNDYNIRFGSSGLVLFVNSRLVQLGGSLTIHQAIQGVLILCGIFQLLQISAEISDINRLVKR